MPTQCLAPYVQRNEQGLRMAQFMADYLVGLCVLMVQAHLHIRIADGLQAQELVQGTYLALIGVVLALGNAELAVFQGAGRQPLHLPLVAQRIDVLSLERAGLHMVEPGVIHVAGHQRKGALPVGLHGEAALAISVTSSFSGELMGFE